jgi:hypothetical protein
MGTCNNVDNTFHVPGCIAGVLDEYGKEKPRTWETV